MIIKEFLICSAMRLRNSADHMIIGIDGIKVELQIRTILMDAWSCMDSILVYKKNTPISNDMKRDIHKIAKWSRKMDKMVAGMIEHTHKQS